MIPQHTHIVVHSPRILCDDEEVRGETAEHRELALENGASAYLEGALVEAAQPARASACENRCRPVDGI